MVDSGVTGMGPRLRQFSGKQGQRKERVETGIAMSLLEELHGTRFGGPRTVQDASWIHSSRAVVVMQIQRRHQEEIERQQRPAHKLETGTGNNSR